MSKHKIHHLRHGISIQAYNNGSYGYWTGPEKGWRNIPAELGKVLVNELNQNIEWTEAASTVRITFDRVTEVIIVENKPQTIDDYEEHSVWGPEAYMEQHYTKKQLEALAKEAQDLDMGYGKDDK